MTTKKFGQKRYFLNPDEGVAAASFTVSASHSNLDNKGKHWPSLEAEATLQLSDCNRQISLDFDLWLKDDKRGSLKVIKDKRKKLELLKKIIDEFVEQTSAAYDHVEEQLDAYVEARKAHEKTRNKKKA